MGVKKPDWQLKAESAISLSSQSPDLRPCLLLAHNGHQSCGWRLPLSGVKQTSESWVATSVIEHPAGNLKREFKKMRRVFGQGSIL
jgi:hypothetical protein